MAETEHTNGTNGTNETNGTAEAAPAKSPVPAWVTAELFESVLKSTTPEFKSITKFSARPGMTVGENYATVMLRIEIDIELNDGKSKNISFMMKTPHDLPMFEELSKVFDIFQNESLMYEKIIPALEKIYHDVDIQMKFAPDYYALKAEKSNILLDDLRPRGYKNANRLEGLDMEHTKCVLQKLAQWHAASAVYVSQNGKFDDKFISGMFSKVGGDMMKQMNDTMGEALWKCLPTYEGHELYKDNVEKIIPRLSEIFMRSGKCDPNEFNVLNHGDCWSNNVMFQYDAFGKIKDTIFVDFQMSRYGTLAQDLFYFLLSSPKLELKLKQFEYFIKYYHDNLIENLTLLKYTKKCPTLKDIHISLYKHGLWGYMTATGVMCAVLLDPTEGATFEAFAGDSTAGNNLRLLMYSNPRYKKHIEVILPWLYNRGALEY